MATRLWTALLMLAAVFAMHGLQCTSASAHSATAGPGPVPVALTAPTTPGGHPADAAVPHLPGPMADDRGVAGLPALAPAGVGHGSTPHGSVERLWTLCLAVLASGVAVLLVVFGARLGQLTQQPPWRPGIRGLRWLSPPRPPDLSSLCLLRI
jgi:hypothetical protein